MECSCVETLQQSLSFDNKHILCRAGMYQESVGTTMSELLK